MGTIRRAGGQSGLRKLSRVAGRATPDLEQNALNVNHQTPSEIKDFNTLGDAICAR